jgi:hypothetical protein
MENVATGDCKARSTATRPAMKETVRLPLHRRPRAESADSARRYQAAAVMTTTRTSSGNGLRSHWVMALWTLNGRRPVPCIPGIPGISGTAPTVPGIIDLLLRLGRPRYEATTRTISPDSTR